MLSLGDVFVGDPKTSVAVDNSASLTYLQDESIAIYPNPSSGIITIQYGNVKPSSITVLNMQGQVVRQINSDFEVAIDLTDLVNGSYIVNIHLDSETVRKKIVLSN